MSRDRIFPIRSVLESGSYVPAVAPDVANTDAPDDANTDDANTDAAQERESMVESGLLVWSNGRFINCEEEPIHIPGSIQSYGALIAIEEVSWVVRQVSENSADVIGIQASDLLKGQSLKTHLTQQGIDILEDRIASVSHFPEDSGPDVFRIYFVDSIDQTPLYCALHRNDENENLIILEFARKDGNSKRPVYVPSDGETIESTLDSKSKRRYNELFNALHKLTMETDFDSMMTSFQILNKMESYLATMPDIKSLSEQVARLVRQIIVFDRVVVYQFDEEWNGECIAESLNPLVAKDLQPFLGLHFPASDIPPQARRLYSRNKIRYLYSRQQKSSRLLCRSRHDLKQPLDLTFSVLRSMSPIHLVCYFFNVRNILEICLSNLLFRFRSCVRGSCGA